ncbi:MAG: tetratricopeptide repeat protein [Deltaproteobacteria bacterium]|jgi:tetratricopeptide (TPR) repeat protein|nr:tetratricopeptide repeat protein [Deltaproteobacteria bacterium]
MKKFCNGHPTRKAHWHCSKCNTLLCPECVAARESENYGKKEIHHFCPKCNLPVDWVGLQNLIEPFWNRMPRIFAYPLALPPLLLISAISIVTLFLSGPGLISSILRGAMWLIVLKYSFESLKATAGGNLRPPPVNSKTISEDIQQVFKQFAIYLIIFMGFGYISFKAGILAGIAFAIVALFFVPSMIILLVTSGSLFHAINPVVFFGLTLRIGWAYILMYFFLFLLGSAPAYLGQYVIRFLPAEFHPMLFGFARSFYTIVSYHLMGYVILQYHKRIGYQVDYEDFSDPTIEDFEPQKSDPDAVVLSKLAPLIKEGKLDEAIAVVKNMTEQQPISGVKLSDRYYNLLKMRKRNAELLAHGVAHLDILTAQNQKDKAIAVFTECRTSDTNFLPTASALFKLAGWLNETGKTKAAVAVYNTLAKSYPDNPLVPKSYFRIAQIFHDRLMNKEKAKKALGLLLQKYPDHDIVPQAESFLARL